MKEEKIDYQAPYFKGHPERVESYLRLSRLIAEREAWGEKFICQQQCRKDPGRLNLEDPEFIRLFKGEAQCPRYSEDCWAGRLARERDISQELKDHRIPRIYREVSYANSKPSLALQTIQKWEKEEFSQGKALVLSGGTGSGKTHAVLCFLRSWLQKQKRYFRFYYSSEFFNRLRYAEPEDKRAMLFEAKDAELLILDDLGVEKRSDYTEAVLDEIIWHREGNRLPLIITTNHSPQALQEVLGARVMDRLKGWATILVTREKSLRGLKGGQGN